MNIDKSIDYNKYYIYRNNKPILSEVTIKKLKDSIKENITPPNKNKKIFILGFNYQQNHEHPLVIICSQKTITKHLALVMEDDDITQTITFDQEELKKYGFKKSYISKIIKAVKNYLISFENSSVTITDVFNATK